MPDFFDQLFFIILLESHELSSRRMFGGVVYALFHIEGFELIPNFSGLSSMFPILKTKILCQFSGLKYHNFLRFPKNIILPNIIKK